MKEWVKMTCTPPPHIGNAGAALSSPAKSGWNAASHHDAPIRRDFSLILTANLSAIQDCW